MILGSSERAEVVKLKDAVVVLFCCYSLIVFFFLAGWLTLEQQQSRSQMISVQQSGLIEFTGKPQVVFIETVWGVGEGAN